MKTKILTLVILALLMPIGYAYAWDSNDNSDRLSNNQSGVFSPGYLNAAKQQAYEIINQNNKPKSWWNNLVDAVKNKTSNKVEEQANTKVTTEVKKKTSSVKETTAAQQPNVIEAPGSDKLEIGTGSDKLVDASNRVIAESFNGVRYWYAGFDGQHIASNTTLSSAISSASSGDRVVVRSGNYDAPLYNTLINIKNGVSLYGGYGENGIRNIEATPTILTGWYTIKAKNITQPTEINGFMIRADASGIWAEGSSGLTIANNIFTPFNSQGGGIYSIGSTLLVKNNRFTQYHGIFDSGSSTITVSNNSFICLLYSISAAAGSNISSSNNNFTRQILSTTAVINSANSGKVLSTNDYFDPSIVTLTRGSGITIQNTSTQLNSSMIEQLRSISFTDQSSSLAGSTNLNNLSINNPYWRSNIYGNYNMSGAEIFRSLLNNNISANFVSKVFKGLLANKNTLAMGGPAHTNEALIGKLVTEALSSTIAIPSITTENMAGDMQLALVLANILKNPTEDQKAVLDAVESLLADMKSINEKAGANSELTKAENDLLQMVASVLLAQGVPDLLKAGDIEGLKGIFKDLGSSKDKIMLNYTLSIKPYYSNIVKELTTNLAMLQLKGMLSKKITEEELRNLEPKEIDKILENIRRANDKSFEMAYILQQDNKYRKEYLDPSNKALEANMRLMLTGFTQKINKALEDKR